MVTVINFDNAATTFPKPMAVKNAMMTALQKYGGNPGRSGHTLSIETAEAVYNSRKICSDFFSAETENTIFTLNCTHALNFAIKGVLKGNGDIITSSLEHNSVARPIVSLNKAGCSYSIADVSKNDIITLSNFEKLINPKTKLIVCTVASNVTGQILPISGLAELCKYKKICFIVDAAQAAGIVPLKIGNGINILCMPGHKGLYGPTGTGLLISDGEYKINPIIEGGTGSTSLELFQPDFLPESLESGTINTIGCIALGAGVNFVKNVGITKIFNHENALCDIFIKGIIDIDGISVYRNNNCKYVPIVSFNIAGMNPDEITENLSKANFGLRSGIHCSAFAHTSLGTTPYGTVRFAPSIFNSIAEVTALITKLKQISKKT